jgi:hypothetical protein
MRNKCSIIVLLMFILMGCAPRVVIMVDGVPVPEYAYHMRSPAMEGLSIEVIAAKYINADEAGEPVLWPVYFRVDEMYYVDPDSTEYIGLTIKVRNPNKVWYELIEYGSSEPVIGRGDTHVSTNGIYSGRLRFKHFNITHKTKNDTKQSHRIEVRDEEGRSIIRIGKFTYKVIRP